MPCGDLVGANFKMHINSAVLGFSPFEDHDVLRAANRLLREIIRYHLGGKELQSRKVLREVHRGRIAPREKQKNTS